MNKIKYYSIFLAIPFAMQMLAVKKSAFVRPVHRSLQTITRAIPNPTIGLNFTAYSAANARGNLIFSPNNPTGDVGPTQYIFSSYGAVRSFNKFTGLPDGILDIYGSTFSPGSQGDPQIRYNRFTQQWFLTFELFDPLNGEPDNLNYQISNTPTVTPATQWAYFQIPYSVINPSGGGLGSFIDYQQPAYDQNATYNGVSTFNTSATYIGSSLTVIPNSSLAPGQTPNIKVFPGLFPDSAVGEVAEGFPAPATNFDTNPTYGYFVSLIYDQPAGIIGNQIGLYRILDTATDTPELGPLVTITLPFSFAYNSLNASHKGNLFGSVGLLQVSTIPIAPHVRNHQLYYGTVCQVDDTGTANTAGDRIGIQWYQFDLTGDTTGRGLGTESPSTVPVLIQSGTLFDDSASNPLFYFMPSLITNKNNDMIITFCSSGNNAYVNAGYAFRAASDALGSLRTPVYATNTSFPQNYNAHVSLNPGPDVQRWGDAAFAAIDPSNDLNFWLTQSFAALQNAWGMQATQVIPA